MALTKTPFKRIEAYKHRDGTTVNDELIELYQTAPPGGEDPEDVLTLMTFFNELEYEGELKGDSVAIIIPGRLSIWEKPLGNYALYFSYKTQSREICLLSIHRFGEGSPPPIPEAIRRTERLYKSFIERCGNKIARIII